MKKTIKRKSLASTPKILLLGASLGLFVALPSQWADAKPFAYSSLSAVERPNEDFTVKGRILNDKGEPIPGVNVVIKGTITGVVTDADGRYSITLSDPASVLLISFVGFTTEEIRVNGRTDISVSLNPDIATLSDVVVMGYGTQRKRDVTGSVASVSAEQIRAVPVMGADQALQGRVSGVQVIQSSGAPGGGVQVRIRGVNSAAGNGANQPLYVVDGIPITWDEGSNGVGIGTGVSNSSSPLASINPNDIESMEVLKDASATAIYGARAANGVVLITTKSGKAGKTIINFDTYFGVQSLRKKIPVTNVHERVGYYFEHRRNAATRANEIVDSYIVNPFLQNQNTDWQDAMFRQATMQNHSLSASGGTEKVQFAVSGDYFDQQGIVINTYSKRYATRLNLDVKATDRLSFGMRTSLSFQTSNSVDTDEQSQSQLMSITFSSPLAPIYDQTGNYAGRPNTSIASSVAGEGANNSVANVMQRRRRADRHRITSNVYGEYKIIDGLKFKSVLGIDYLFNELSSFAPLWQRGTDISGNGTASGQSVFISMPRTYNWMAEQLLTYDKSFGKHTVNALLGYSAQQFLQKNLGAGAQNGNSAALDQLSNQPTPLSPFGGEGISALVSQFARVNYAYDDRYLFTGTIRRDGSSRFGKNNQYGAFPSFSLGWRISEEAFMKQNRIFSELKLRTSYGVTGSQNIGDFLFASLAGGANAVWGNNVVNGIAPNRFENPDIRWEQNKQFDVGLDIGLLKGRINLTFDYYDKLTDGLLAGMPISVISGVGNSFVTNTASVSNKGFEAALNTSPINNDNFRWDLDFNIATNRNEVVSLGATPFIAGATLRPGTFINRTQVGQPIGSFHVLIEDGQYKNWEEAADAPRMAIGNAQPYFAPGDFKPVDQDNNDTINDRDRVWYGSPFPDFFGGINNTLTYKGLSLNVFANFQQGNLMWNNARMNSETFEGNAWLSTYNNRWRPSEPNVQTSVSVPRNNNPILASNRYLDDASFFRIRTITLSYELPKTLIAKAKLSRARVYVSGNNLITLTKYQGWDPEVNSFGSNMATNGVDIGAYPIAKSVIMGLNLTF